MRAHSLAFVFFAVSVPVPAQQPLNWITRTPSNPPSARNDWGVVYDSGRDVVVAFGGFLRGVNVPTGQTWELRNWRWTQRMPANAPSPRLQVGMAYDVAMQRTLLFGGLAGPGAGLLSDTWSYDGSNWTQLSPSTVPSARTEQVMAYDAARGVIVMFGGGGGGGVLNDTWEWVAGNWIQRMPANSPPPRCCAQMVYDSGRQRMVLFGGFDPAATPTSLADTWEWDGSNWMQVVTATSPPGRAEHAMAYDLARGRVVLYGGGRGMPFTFLNDTWEYDGTTWMRINTAQNAGARWGMETVYVPPRNRVVLVGSPYPNGTDVGVYGRLAPTSSVRMGTGCPGTPGIPSLFVSDPWVGSTNVTATILQARPNALAIFGISPPAAPQTFGSCTLYLSLPAPALVGMSSQFGFASFSFGIPFDTALLGTVFHGQAFVIDSGAALGIAASTGVVLSLGD